MQYNTSSTTVLTKNVLLHHDVIQYFMLLNQYFAYSIKFWICMYIKVVHCNEFEIETE